MAARGTTAQDARDVVRFDRERFTTAGTVISRYAIESIDLGL